MKNQIKLGWSEVDFTPKMKVKLAGQFFERISDEVETPLTITAMAIDSGEDCVVICSCDLVAVSENMMECVRQKLKGEIKIPLENVIVGAIHSHTSILYKRNNKTGNSLNVLKSLLPEEKQYVALVSEDQDVMNPDDALEYISAKIAEAVIAALDNRENAYIANGFGRAAVGMCRRVCYDDGSAKMWGDTNNANFTELEGGNDSGIELLFTYDSNKKLTGVVANVACPAQVVEHRSFISSDYWGKVKILLREKLGNDIKILGLCSAAGDQCPRDMIRWVNPETPIDDPNIHREHYIERTADPSMFDIKGTWTIGRRIANEILYAYEDVTDYQDKLEFEHKFLKLDLPVRRVTISEYEAAQKVIKDFIAESGDKVNFADNAKLHVHAGTIQRYLYQQDHDMVSEEIHILRLGDIAIATNPFELFLDYGNQIRARSLAKQTFLIQLCCGADGYLPTERAEKGSHYSAYVSSGITGHVGGEILVRKMVEEINSLWKK